MEAREFLGAAVLLSAVVENGRFGQEFEDRFTAAVVRITSNLFCSVAVWGWEAEDILTSWKRLQQSIYKTD